MKNKIYILGITGMLGHELFVRFNKKQQYKIKGSTRLDYYKELKQYKNIDFNISIFNLEKIEKKLKEFKPDYVLNCIGFVKQKIKKFSNSSEVYYVNSIFPHEISKITKKIGAKLIHFSTDCVFSGRKGNYCETDNPDAYDLYGHSKQLGELKKRSDVITIRTSIIGHELKTKNGLLEWFLAQKKKCIGYANVFFSGLTTFEVFTFLDLYLFKKNSVSGLIHLSSSKISKYKLLKLISKIYQKKIIIKKDNKIRINRTLNSKYIERKLFYKCSSWEIMIKQMYLNKIKNI
jgi:dTDP-4-dehydrorhamnose reductase